MEHTSKHHARLLVLLLLLRFQAWKKKVTRLSLKPYIQEEASINPIDKKVWLWKNCKLPQSIREIMGTYNQWGISQCFMFSPKFYWAILHSKSGDNLKAYTLFVMELNVVVSALLCGAAVEMWGAFPQDNTLVPTLPAIALEFNFQRDTECRQGVDQGGGPKTESSQCSWTKVGRGPSSFKTRCKLTFSKRTGSCAFSSAFSSIASKLQSTNAEDHSVLSSDAGRFGAVTEKNKSNIQ